MEQDTLREFLLNDDLYKVFNCKEIETRAGMARNSLSPWLSGHRKTMSDDNRRKLIEFLYELAYQLNNTVL